MNAKPKVIISSADAERLEELIAALSSDTFPGKNELEAELDRAEIVRREDMPPNVVTMNSTVKFKVASSDETFCLRLVYPQETDASGGTISILAPIGSALLGLSQGDEIEWPTPAGGTLSVHIDEVVHQPERSAHLR